MNNSYLKLLSYKPLRLEKVRDNNYEAIREWVKDYMVIEDYNHLIAAIKTSTIACSVNGSFYTNKSRCIAVYFIITQGEKKLASRDLITTVALKYQNTYSAEIYIVLVYLKLIEFILIE